MPKKTCLCCGLAYTRCPCLPGLTQAQIAEAIRSWLQFRVPAHATMVEKRDHLSAQSPEFHAWLRQVNFELIDRWFVDTVTAQQAVEDPANWHPTTLEELSS